MRVAMASYGFNRQGGIERASYEVARRLSRAGDDVTLVAHRVDLTPDELAADGLRSRAVALPPHPRPLASTVFSRAATRAVAEGSYDIVHNQGGCALRRQDVITAHSCHRAWWQLKLDHGERIRAHLNPLHHAVLRLERANYRPGAYREVIAVSEGVKREIVRWYDVPAERITVIPNGVDAERFRPGRANAGSVRADVRQRHGLAEDDVVLLWVGKEFRRKGLQPVVEALPELPAHVKVLAVGGDRSQPFADWATRAGIRDRVVFAGHQTRVEDYFEAGDVFCFPTLYEAFALVTLEAAAAGLPLVTTRVNGTEEFVRDGDNGLFVDRSGGSVAAAVRRLVDDPGLRRRMGRQALADVQSYTWDAAAQRTAEVYRRAAAGLPHPG